MPRHAEEPPIGGVSKHAHLDQRLSDLGGEPLSPSLFYERIGDFKLADAFHIDVTQARAAHERSVWRPNRPKTDAMIGPVTKIGLKVSRGGFGCSNAAQETRHVGIPMEFDQVA